MQDWLRGDRLAPTEQLKALSRFVHRYTGTHKPAWARKGNPPVHFADDVDWLCNTYFMVTRDDRLDDRAEYCESHPTWPNNPELRRRYAPDRCISERRRYG